MKCSVHWLLQTVLFCLLVLALAVLAGCGQAEEMNSWFAKTAAAQKPGRVCAEHQPLTNCFLRAQFNGGLLPPEFEIRLGPGSLTQSHGRLRYQVSGTRERQAGDGDIPGFDYHGYAVLPSLKISEAFRGRQWALETHIGYHFPADEHGRRISLAIGFAKKPDGKLQSGVTISRYADGVSGANDLNVVIQEGDSVKVYFITRNSNDSYFFKILRNNNSLAVYVSAGDRYELAAGPYKFTRDLADEQTFSINSVVASAQHTYADIDFISIQGANVSRANAAQAPAVPRCPFSKHGTEGSPVDVKAEEVMAAVKGGCDVELNYVTIEGPLYFNEISPGPFHASSNDATDEQFLHDLRNEKAQTNVRYVAGQLHMQNCRLPALAVPSYTVFLETFQLSHCEIDSLMLSRVLFLKPVDLSCLTATNLSMTYSFFAPGASADFSFLQCSDKTMDRDASSERSFRYADFRGTRFGAWTSFYRARFIDGASFTDAYFRGDASFSGISLGSGTIALRHGQMQGRLYLVSTLENPIHCGSGDIDMSEARISELLVRTDEQQWTCTTSIVLTLARIRCLLVSHITFEGTLDLSGATFSPSQMADSECPSNVSLKFEAVRFKDNSSLRLIEWPARKTLLSQPMYVQLQSIFQQSGDTQNERLVFYDRLSQTNNSSETPWYSKCLRAARGLLFAILWTATEYFTSVVRVLVTGFVLTFGFALALACFDPLPLRRIQHRLRLHLRLAEAPILAPDDKDIGPAFERFSTDSNKAFKTTIMRFCHRLWLTFRFSCVNFAKIGFGGLRIDPQSATWSNRSGRALLMLVWSEWALGYLWYFLLVYTLAAAIPVSGTMLK